MKWDGTRHPLVDLKRHKVQFTLSLRKSMTLCLDGSSRREVVLGKSKVWVHRASLFLILETGE
jgi:hypothetical protein